jgi:tetratricopeptide (TPR) repeat protein
LGKFLLPFLPSPSSVFKLPLPSLNLTRPESSGVDNEERAISLRCALLSNRAACFLPLGEYKACLEDCTEVLAIDPGKSKARYRRGLAYESLGKFQEAYEDLKQVRVNYKLLSHVRFVSLASISTPKQLYAASEAGHHIPVVEEVMDRVWLRTVMPPGMSLREERSERGGGGRGFSSLVG